MKKRDRAIVAVILAAALVAGLVLVRRALERDAQAQADSLASAQFNGAAGAGETEDAGGGTGAQGEAPGAAPGQTGEDSETPPEDGTAPDGGTDGEDGGAGSVQAGGDTAGLSAAILSAEPPSAGGGEMTLAALSQWMERESSGALSADSMLQAEEALAAGVGTADDALRRTFAQSQAACNDETRRSQLAEEAASLGLAYLRCRDLAVLREESAAFYEALAAAVSAQAGTAADQVQADLQTVEEALAAAELSLAEAQADLQAARDDLNAALGNPYGTDIAVTGALEKETLPSLTGDAAAAQALAARNEIKGAAYEAERAQQALTQLRYAYAPDSPEVLAQQAALQEAQAACAKAESQVEADVRDRLTRLGIQDQELAALSASLEKTGTAPPETAYALTGGEETGWSSNLAQLMGQWAEIESARAGLITGIAQFNLDVLCFQHAVGAGCTAVTI